jgi:predicted nucleotidyltransferase
MADEPVLNDDFVDLLRAFDEAGVDFVVVGAHALAAYGVVRATGDLDVFVRPHPEVAARVIAGLRAFGAPLAAHGVAVDDFARPGTVYQMGLVPRRIDVLTEISGVTFDEAVLEATRVESRGVAFRVIGRSALLVNKRASARPKDLEDLRLLDALGTPSGES